MASTRYYLGNWKMNLGVSAAQAYVKEFGTAAPVGNPASCVVGVAPTFTSLPDVIRLRPSWLKVGAQNVHWLDSGAHTGEISPVMLSELGVDFVIIGHSERRAYYGETDDVVAQRAEAAIKHGFLAVVCVGETLAEFEAGVTEQVVERQLKKGLSKISGPALEKLVIAYEPVWAIGTGKAATPEIAAQVHIFIRQVCRSMFGEFRVPVIYGGSTTPENIASIMATGEVDGALVGGASLKPPVFKSLIEGAEKAIETCSK